LSSSPSWIQETLLEATTNVQYYLATPAYVAREKYVGNFYEMVMVMCCFQAVVKTHVYDASGKYLFHPTVRYD
jgi:hypothetical protein